MHQSDISFCDGTGSLGMDEDRNKHFGSSLRYVGYSAMVGVDDFKVLWLVIKIFDQIFFLFANVKGNEFQGRSFRCIILVNFNNEIVKVFVYLVPNLLQQERFAIDF